MGTKIKLVLSAAFALTLIGCGNGFKMTQGSTADSLASQAKAAYDIASADTNAVASGQPIDIFDLGDVSQMTDDQIIEAVKEKLTQNLQNLEQALANLNSSGENELPVSLDGIESLTQQLIDKLDNDQQFRSFTIAIARHQSPDVSELPSPSQLPPLPPPPALR